ncbi:ATP-binding cassette domain-containing protein, partial [Hungatella sp.]
MNSLIQCSHADFGYENQDAVVDVTMKVNPGDYVCIVGENGSGKSTLMKGMLGLLKPTKGTISVSDELKK